MKTLLTILLFSSTALAQSYIHKNLGIQIEERSTSLRPNQGPCSPMTIHKVESVYIALSRDTDHTYKGLQKYHIDEKGFCDIGFHYGINSSSGDPLIYALRDLKFKGSFLRGKNNNIGIMIQGTLTKEKQRKIKQLVVLLRQLVPTLKNIKSLSTDKELTQAIKSLNKDIFKSSRVAARSQ